jgi:hypothetical protein
MVCFEINNGLLILNMGLAKKAIESNNAFGQQLQYFQKC